MRIRTGATFLRLNMSLTLRYKPSDYCRMKQARIHPSGKFKLEASTTRMQRNILKWTIVSSELFAVVGLLHTN